MIIVINCVPNVERVRSKLSRYQLKRTYVWYLKAILIFGFTVAGFFHIKCLKNKNISFLINKQRNESYGCL